jgi:small-conductance mechanosensitive channel
MKALRFLLAGVILLLLATPAGAQPPASPAPASQPATPALTPAQARAALEVLNDPKQRAAFTATLEALAKAAPTPAASGAAPASPAASSSAASAPTPAGELPIPLAPDSLGAQVLVTGANFLNHLSDRVVDAAHAMQSLPSLLEWATVMATNPVARDLLLDAAWRLAVALLAGLAAQYLLLWALRPSAAALEALAPNGNRRPADAPGLPAPGTAPAPAPAAASPPAAGKPPPAAATATDAEQDGTVAGEETEETAEPATQDALDRAEVGDIEAPPRRRPSSWTLLRRLPLVLARLALDLIPVLGFTAAGHLIAAAFGGPASSRLVLLAVVDAYALCAAVLAVAAMLLSPHTPRLRLVHLPDTLAAYLMRWTRRIVVIAVFGYAVAEVGLLFGLSDVAHAGVLKTTGFIVHACLAVVVVQKRRAIRRLLRAPPDATGPAARVRNGVAAVWHWIALFFIVATWLVWAVEIRNGFSALAHFFVLTVLLLIGARLLLIAVLGVIDRAVHVPPETAARYPELETRLRLYHPVLRSLLRLLVYVLCVLALLQAYGFGAFTWFADSELGRRIASAVATLTVTILLALLVWEAANLAIQRHLARLALEQQLMRSARLRTLLPLLRSTLLITILVVTGLMVLSEIGINIAPLLAGAGIVGVAIGFGSQKLVQDLITGIFLLLENAMQVGDWVTVAGLSGSIENLSVRTIRLRAADGSVHIIPFSAVTSVTNVNRGLGNASVAVTVEFEEDTDRVCAVLKEIVAGMRAEPDFAKGMLSDLQLWGVDKVDGAGVTIDGQVVCTDSGRWSVQREFNRRMKKRFQELGIKLFNPMRSVAVTLPPPAPAPGTGAEDQKHERVEAADATRGGAQGGARMRATDAGADQHD